MPCTTLLVGKNASFDHSTMIARNDDSPSGSYMPKKFVVVKPEEQPREYHSVISHVTIPLPEKPMQYTAVPNAVKGEGIWAAAGINSAQVAMTATETITSNPRVLGADPLVGYVPPKEGAENSLGTPGGVGEEDFVVLVLPYIRSAREGVLRLGKILETYGTYEMNGVAFSDQDEIWWLETIGGHHWMAKRVPDDSYVVMPNQLGIDRFDLNDAFGKQENHLCSADLREFIAENHLNLTPDEENAQLDPRAVFGSHDDADHVYNTPRAWYMLRTLNPHTFSGNPIDDDLPWCMVPERKVTPEDIKYLLSSHFQGTPYDPYMSYGDKSMSGAFRSIGVNRTDFMGFMQLRPDMPKDCRGIQWLAFGSNVFNTMVPFYTCVDSVPEYLTATTGTVSTDSFYWTSRLIAAMADASYDKSINVIERYEEHVLSESHRILNKYDRELKKITDDSADGSQRRKELCEKANEEIAGMLKIVADDTLSKVLYHCSNRMKNSYSRSDA